MKKRSQTPLAELRGREARGRETFGGELLAAAHGEDEELDSVRFAMLALIIFFF